jgi:hypothetical protein
MSRLRKPVRSAFGVEQTWSADLQIGVMIAEGLPDADLEIGATKPTRVV